jgi:hypothetical protein
MCLATICRVDNKPKGFWGRLWQWFSHSPLRLLTLSSAIHGALLSILLLLGAMTNHLQWLAFAIVFGIISLPLAGYLLTKFPEWFRRSGLHYGWSFATFLTGFSALLLIEIGLVTQGSGWLITGTLLLLTAWSIALRGLWWVYKWVSLEKYGAAPHLMLCLYGGVAGLTTFLIGAVLESTLLIQASLVAGLLCLWVLASAGTIRLRKQVS